MAVKRCAHCKQLIPFGAYVDGEEAFCSLPCLTASPLQRFCADCLGETSDVSPGHTFLVGAMGSRLMGVEKRCPTCHSIEQREWFGLLVPLVPLQLYRCRYSTPTSYVGRRLLDDDATR